MRVIKAGIIRKQEWTTTCHNCGCVFAYEKGDIHADQREGDFVVCPTCRAYINVMNRAMETKEYI